MWEILNPRLLIQQEDFDVVLEVHGVHFYFAAAADSPDGSVRNSLVVDQALAHLPHLPTECYVLGNRHVLDETARLKENRLSRADAHRREHRKTHMR